MTEVGQIEITSWTFVFLHVVEVSFLWIWMEFVGKTISELDICLNVGFPKGFQSRGSS